MNLPCPPRAEALSAALCALGLTLACSSSTHSITGAGAGTSTGASSGGASTSTGSSSSASSSTGSSSTGSTGAGSSSSTASSSSSSGSTTGHHTTSASSSGSTTGAPLCNDCRTADCPCAGSAPFCDQETGRCLSCRGGSHADCPSAAAPICETDAGACVACLSPGDCTRAIRPYCGKDLTCVSCASDSDCSTAPNAPHCATDPTSPLYGQCWDCVASGQCVLGEVCDPYRGLCVADCRKANSCPNNTSCGQLTGLCSISSCSKDADCENVYLEDGGLGPPLCDPVYARCVACLNDTFCASGQHCQQNPLLPNYGNCQDCVGSGQGQCDTAHGYLCESNGHCELDCRSDAGYGGICGWGIEGEMIGLPSCQVTTGLCVQCLQSDDCGVLSTVLQASIPPLCDTENNSCVECRGAADCPFDNAGCIPAQGCGVCRHDSDCPTGQVCHDTPGAPASLGGPEYCFCKDDQSCNGGTCVVGGVGFNYNPYSLTEGSYSGYTGSCFCVGDAGTSCPAGSLCTSVYGGVVNNSNNPGHCLLTDGGLL